MSKNDDKILILKKQIDNKKEELLKNKVKFTPETNCVLDFEGTNYNLNVCSEEILCMLMIRLNVYVISANDLGVFAPSFNGYSITAWISDIKNKLLTIKLKQQESDLKKMEIKLDKLLSDDKKTELEINEIEASLGL